MVIEMFIIFLKFDVTFYCYFIFVETKVLRAIQDNIQKLVVR